MENESILDIFDLFRGVPSGHGFKGCNNIQEFLSLFLASRGFNKSEKISTIYGNNDFFMEGI
jgi:hypothetical protein